MGIEKNWLFSVVKYVRRSMSTYIVYLSSYFKPFPTNSLRVVGHLAARAKRSLSRTFHRLFQRSYSSHEVQKNSTDMHIYACLGSPVLLLMSDRTRK